MNSNDNYYQNKLDGNARDYDEAPLQAMTIERAQALVEAHRDGRLMSDELQARAYEALKVVA